MVKAAFSLIGAGVLLAATIAPASADSVLLNSGEEVQGEILSETDTNFLVEVHVASGIIDQRTIAKSDVKSVKKTPPDERAYRSLKGCQVGPNSLTPAAYDAAIVSLQSFQRRFPNSSFHGEAQANLDAFKKEKTRVEAGELKWNNRWYTKHEAVQQKYQIYGQMILSVMKDQVSRNDFVGALNTFARLEAVYPNSKAYPDGVDLAIQVIHRLQRDADRLALRAKGEEQQFNAGIDLVAEPEKSQMIAARKRQIDAAEAALAAADRAGLKWKPLIPISEKSTQAVKTTCAAELLRLQQLPVTAMRGSVAAAEAAFKEVTAKNAAGAEAKLKEAQALWAENESLTRLTPALTALKQELAATPTPTPAPSPGAPPAHGAKPAASPSSGKSADASLYVPTVGRTLAVAGWRF